MLEKYNITGEIYLGLSGGQDSVVLLHKLAVSKYKHKTTAIYINHNLSPNATSWQNFCEDLCSKLGVKFQTYSINLDTNNTNIENQAREKRREIWQNLLDIGDVILLAHHLEDNVETVLYRLFRGSGVDGLSGIKELVNLGKGRVIRPLLNISKTDIENYAVEHNLKWIEDESNKNNKFDRNFIRNEVLPLVKTRWPNVSNNIANTIKICGEYVEHIDNGLDKNIINVNNKLNIKELEKLNEFTQKQIIRKWFNINNFKNPSIKNIELIYSDVILAGKDKNPDLKLQDCVVRRYRDELYLLSLEKARLYLNKNMGKKYDLNEYVNNNIFEFSIEFNKNIKYLVRLDIDNNALIINGRNYKLENNIREYKLMLGSMGEKAKKTFQELGIAPWIRNGILSVIDENNKINIVIDYD